jgi:hypothetical protein
MTLTSDRYKLARKVWRRGSLVARVYEDRLTGQEIVVYTAAV